MRALLRTATTAFDVLRTGNVGVGGSTGALIVRSLRAIEALLIRQGAPIAPPVTPPKTT